MNLFYKEWETDDNPVANGFIETSRTDVFLKGDFHTILQLSNRPYNLVKSVYNPFVYHIHLRLKKGSDLWAPFENYVPSDIVKKINKNGILVVTDDEGHDLGPKIIKKEAQLAGLNLDKILYLTPSLPSIKDQIINTKFYSCNCNKLLIRLKTEKESTDLLKESLSKEPTHFLASLSNRCDEHKIFMVNELFDKGLVTDENHITFFPPAEDKDYTDYLNNLIHKDLKKMLPLQDEFWNPVYMDTGEYQNLVGFESVQAYTKCKLVIMNMTPVNDKFRCFNRSGGFWHNFQLPSALMLKKPFLINSDVPSLHFMKELGFKTFDSIWDESYDEELDTKVKTKAITEVILHIKKNPDLLEECKEITEFNFKKFFSLKYNQEIVKTIDEILQSE